MSTFSFYPSTSPVSAIHSSHSHGHNSRRRGGPPKLAQPKSVASMHQQQYLRMQMSRQAREPAPETLDMERYMTSLEQWCSLDFDDDMEFIPNLLSSEEIHSHSSDSGSSTGSSPDASPLQHHQQVASSFVGSGLGPALMMQPSFVHHHNITPQPSTRAIAIIDPSTGFPVSNAQGLSPSASPNRRW